MASVVFIPKAGDHLDDLHRYIAAAATPDIATNYVDAIITGSATAAVTTRRPLGQPTMDRQGPPAELDGSLYTHGALRPG